MSDLPVPDLDPGPVSMDECYEHTPERAYGDR